MNLKRVASQSLGCIFCYKVTDEIKESCEQEKIINFDKCQKDVQGKMFSLLARHLKVDSKKEHAKLQTQVTSLLFIEDFEESTVENLIRVCQTCLLIVEEFCTLYHQMKSLELRVNWQVDKLWNVMRGADQEPLGGQQFTQAGINGNHQLWEINKLLGFRRHLKRQCKLHKNKLFPRVVLPRKLDICETGTASDKNSTWTPAQEEEGVMNVEDEIHGAMEFECGLSDLAIKTVTSLSQPDNPLKNNVYDLNYTKTSRQDIGINPNHAQKHSVPGSSWEQPTSQAAKNKRLNSSRNVEDVGSVASMGLSYFELKLPPPPPIVVQHQIFSNRPNGNMTWNQDKTATSKITSSSQKVKCNLCEVVCSSWQTLETHKRQKHSTNLSTLCTICAQQCGKKVGFMRHNISFHAENFFTGSKLKCLSNEQFKSYVAHLVSNTVDSFGIRVDDETSEGKIKYKCKYCSLELSNKHTARLHLFWQHLKILKENLAKLQHSMKPEEISHSNQPSKKPSKSNACTHCGLVMSSKANLKLHMNTCHLRSYVDIESKGGKGSEILDQSRYVVAPAPTLSSTDMGECFGDKEELLASSGSGVVEKFNASFGATQVHVGNNNRVPDYGCLSVKREPNEFEFIDETMFLH